MDEKVRELVGRLPDTRELIEMPRYFLMTKEAEGRLTGTPRADRGATDYAISGWFRLYDERFGDPAFDITGTISVDGAPIGRGQTRVVREGELRLGTSLAAIRCDIHSPARRGLDSLVWSDERGRGWMSLVLEFDESILKGLWRAHFSSPTVLRLPVTIGDDGSIRFEMERRVFGELFEGPDDQVIPPEYGARIRAETPAEHGDEPE